MSTASRLIELSAKIDHCFDRARNDMGEFAPGNGGEPTAGSAAMAAAYGAPAAAMGIGAAGGLTAGMAGKKLGKIVRSKLFKKG